MYFQLVKTASFTLFECTILDKCEETIDLLLYEQDGKSHYCFISGFNRLIRPQITSRTNGVTHICKKCFTHFTKQDLFEKHIAYGSKNETVAVKMPSRKTKLEFPNYYKQPPLPFVAYADLNALPNHFLLQNHALMIVTLIRIKNTNHQGFVST